jgi:HK97 family phage major capsid protein
MSWAEIKSAIEESGKAFEEFKKTNDERLKAIKEGNEAKAKELDTKLAKIDADLSAATKLKKEVEIEMENQRERIEELEAKQKTPGKTASQQRQDEYKGVFVDWIRGRGQSPNHEQKMLDLQRKALEAKDVTIGTPGAGGYAVPEEIAREIERQEKLFSPVRRLVKVVQAGTSDYKELVDIRGESSGWVGETGSRTATNTPTLREIVPTHGELYAYPQASEWSLDDMFFNVDAWLAESVAQDFALAEGTAVISGNGTSKPTGILNTTPTAIDDFASPLRAAAVIQYVASTATPDAILPDSLIDLTYKLNAAYRVGSAWTFNSVNAGNIRKLKDTTNQYLWQPGLQAGQPDRLLGFPVEIWEQMPSITQGTPSFPVLFGNFRRGYVLVDRTGLRITRDNVTNVGFVRFYIRKRVGGIILNNNAIKALRVA